MKLEIISQHPDEKTHTTPLLFLHGAWHGAWCWENFLPYFAEQGYEVHALSLRGHGNSEGREHIRWFSIRDYVDDLAQVVDSLSIPPVLIAHSMGGFVAQKYLETHTLPAGVLLATIPTNGIFSMIIRRLKRHPAATLRAFLTLNTWHFVYPPAVGKDALFSEDYPEEEFLRYYAKLQPDSFRLALEAAFFVFSHPKKVKTPLLVLGAEDDRIFTVFEQRKTARAYKTEAILYPHMTHDMMLEQGWESVANQILTWLKSRNL